MPHYISRHGNVVRIESAIKKDGISLKAMDERDNILDEKRPEEVVNLIENREISPNFVEESYLFYLERRKVI